jgi:hypothetical protein
MKTASIVLLSVSIGFLLAVFVLGTPPSVRAGVGQADCASKNGDVNTDGTLDLSDAITILGHLFQGSPTTLAPLCTPATVPSGLPATGHTACWSFDGNEGLWVEVPCGESDCAGQDGAYEAGCPMEGRFVDNGDDTVTDLCTGLMWQKDTADVSGDGQINAAGDTVVWCDASSYCESLEFAGYDDWRLPNARELQSIVDYGRSSPSIDPSFGALSEFYWTSTSYAESPDAAWGVGFNVGYVGIRVKIGDLDFSFNFVRAVRSER